MVPKLLVLKYCFLTQSNKVLDKNQKDILSKTQIIYDGSMHKHILFWLLDLNKVKYIMLGEGPEKDNLNKTKKCRCR